VNLTLYVWRQKGPKDKGHLVRYEARDISSDMSFLEMLDVVNEGLVKRGEEPIAFDSDCREGICGACGQVVNGVPHGPRKKTTVCQLHMHLYRAIQGPGVPGYQGSDRGPGGL
jgi:succinate dehydrogenase / fumarate reductase iron-sulfur subunit